MARNPNPAGTSVWRARNGRAYPLEDLPYGSMIWVQPTEADLTCAVRLDPEACAIAQTWKRTADVPDAQIGIDKAYLPMRKDGRVVALRCKVPAKTRNAIHEFDKTGVFPTEGFMLVGIPPSERIDSQRAQQKRTRERWETIRTPSAKKRTSRYLRNATRRAQVFREQTA